MLFTLYVNDLPDVVVTCIPTLYADDLILLSRAKTPRKAITNLQEDGDRVMAWCDENRLTLNITKTKYMWFASYHKLDNTQDLGIKIKGTDLGEVTEYKYLGVWLDSELTFKKQLEETHHHVSGKLTQLKLIRYYLNQADAVTLYKQAIVPILEYGSFLTDSGPATIVKKYQPLQNRGLRICTRKRIGEMSTNKLHKTCKVQRIEVRRNVQLACLMYKHSKEAENQRPRRHRRTRGDMKVKLNVERPKRTKYRSGPLYRGMLIWDNLEVHIQEQPDIYQFKTELKKHLKCNV